jgi:competence protein ComEC
LLLAAVLLVAINPTEIRQAGFLLSFFACAGILIFASPYLTLKREDPIERWLAQQRKQAIAQKLKSALVVSCAATFATAPVTVWFFGRLTLASIPGTLLLAPLMAPLIAVGIFKVLLPSNHFLIFLAKVLHDLLTKGCELLEFIPFGSLPLARPTVVALSLWLLSALFAVLAVRRLRFRAMLLFFAMGVGALLLPGPAHPSQSHMLDAGRGAAILIQHGCNTTLCDTGPRSSRCDRQLQDRGIRDLTNVLLTHEHEDHIGALPQVLATYGPIPVYAPSGAPFLELRTHSSHPPGLQILWPTGEFRSENANDMSLALRIELPKTKTLITGDLEGAGMRGLLERRSVLSCDLLVLPHHGARQPFLLPLLLQTQPSLAWVPARAGFPSEDLMLVRWLGIPIDASWCGPSAAWPEHSCAPGCRVLAIDSNP